MNVFTKQLKQNMLHHCTLHGHFMSVQQLVKRLSQEKKKAAFQSLNVQQNPTKPKKTRLHDSSEKKMNIPSCVHAAP